MRVRRIPLYEPYCPEPEVAPGMSGPPVCGPYEHYSNGGVATGCDLPDEQAEKRLPLEIGLASRRPLR